MCARVLVLLHAAGKKQQQVNMCARGHEQIFGGKRRLLLHCTIRRETHKKKGAGAAAWLGVRARPAQPGVMEREIQLRRASGNFYY
jgi:hypothetical protein